MITFPQSDRVRELEPAHTETQGTAVSDRGEEKVSIRNESLEFTRLLCCPWLSLVGRGFLTAPHSQHTLTDRPLGVRQAVIIFFIREEQCS